MTHSPSTSALGLEFNAFLFASVHEEPADAPLSVVSALARLDIDPWREAAELTRLPRDAAAQRLAHLLANLPSGRSAAPDLGPIAARLIALLPRHGVPEIARRGSSSGASVLVEPRILLLFLLSLIVSGALVATVGVMTGDQQQAVGAAAATAPAMATSQRPPPNSGPPGPDGRQKEAP
jgi:hypothetical protein